MKQLIFFAVVMLLAAGCVSRPVTRSFPKLQFRQNLTLQEKRELTLALQDRIKNQIYELDYVQQHLAELPYELPDTNKLSQVRQARALYNTEAQSRDLDQTISILCETSDRLADQDERFYARFGISRGPY